jgi:hypothetical protein
MAKQRNKVVLQAGPHRSSYSVALLLQQVLLHQWLKLVLPPIILQVLVPCMHHMLLSCRLHAHVLWGMQGLIVDGIAGVSMAINAVLQANCSPAHFQQLLAQQDVLDACWRTRCLKYILSGD